MFGLLAGAVPWRLIAGLAAALVIYLGALYVVGTIKRVGSLEAQLDQAVELANANAEAAQKIRTDAQQADQAAVKAQAARAAARASADRQRQEINDAPETDNGPVAPVLRRVLDRLPDVVDGVHAPPVSIDRDPRRPDGAAGSASASHVAAAPIP